MEILVAGNLANMGYELAKALNQKGIESKLLLPKYPIQSEDPKTINPEIAETGYPNWISRYDNHHNKFNFQNWKIQVINEMRKKEYELIIALTEFPIFAMFSGKPYIALSTGSDMRSLAFQKSFKGFLMRLAYKRADIIAWSEPDKWPHIQKLKISNKAYFIGIPRSSKLYPQIVDKGELENKFVIFHPTAQNWTEKGNERFLYAYSKLCAVRNDVYLIISDRGPDIEKAKQILDTSNAKNNYRLVPYLDATDLQYYYNLADIIIDQFVFTSFGMIAIEAMKCAKPVMVKINESLYKKFYEKLPPGLINSDTQEEIFNNLNNLASCRELCVKLGSQNKEWLEENLNNSKLTECYIDLCQMLVKR